MNIPDIVRQAEAYASRQDAYDSRLPVCARCGWPIRGPRLVHIPEHEEDYCLDCIEAMTEFNEAAEVEE